MAGKNVLMHVDGYLFSEGIRDDPQPRRVTDESGFEFLDRVRQPAFERQRSWWEAAFSRYPPSPDKKDVAQRFRSGDEAQHFGAAWELLQHELWLRLGWSLTPHPKTPDGRYRDFLVENPNYDSFYLECAVDLESSATRMGERRWSVVEAALRSVESPGHQLMVDLQSIGFAALAVRELCKLAQAQVDRLPAGKSGVVLDVDRQGWRFTVRAMEVSSTGSPVVIRSGARSLDERLYNPIRGRVVDKAQKSTRLDKPFVIALLIMYPLPILSKADVAREALFGTTVTTLGPDLQARGQSNRGDGIWFDGKRTRRSGASAILMQQDLWPGQQLPTLHLHPGAVRPLTAPVPLATCTYEIRHGAVHGRRQETSIGPKTLFGLADDWPGPENWFEGINNDNPLPSPKSWTPRGFGDSDHLRSDSSSPPTDARD